MTAYEKLAALEALRGAHDQTIRTQVVRIVYGPLASEDRNETNVFLETEIAFLRKALAGVSK